MTLARLLLTANLAATGMLIGVIWYVQLVAYPLFAEAGGAFPAYGRAHAARVSILAGPWMVLEAATAGALLWWRPPELPGWMAWSSAALVAVIWASTFAVQAPLVEQITTAWDAARVRRLVATNWVRTAAWTLRGVLLLWVFLRRG